MNFSQARYSFGESSGNVLVELIFSNPSSFDVIVHVMWDDITATGLNNSACLDSSDADYLYGVYSVTVPAKMTMKFVDITICDDDVLEEEETFSLAIISTITIVDNDRKCLLFFKQTSVYTFVPI